MEALDKALGMAQTELAGAEIGLAEAVARAEAARDAQSRLKLAVAALSGEIPEQIIIKPVPGVIVGEPPPAAAPRGTDEDVISYLDRTGEDSLHGSNKAHNATLSPEEFDAERKRRQRKREKEIQAQNPYGTIKCTGCGVVGKLQETLFTAPSGTPVKMLICGGCGNQAMI